MKTLRMSVYAIGLSVMTIICSACANSKSPSQTQQPSDTQPPSETRQSSELRQPTDSSYSDTTRSYIPAQTDSLKKDSARNTPPVGKLKASPADTYDDGYQDGEAMAEEDRLAGRPGMQVGMDDDEEDDEYEDGFDDGYEE